MRPSFGGSHGGQEDKLKKKVKKLPSLPREKNGRKTDQRNREKDWLLSFFPRDQEILTVHVNTWHNST